MCNQGGLVDDYWRVAIEKQVKRADSISETMNAGSYKADTDVIGGIYAGKLAVVVAMSLLHKVVKVKARTRMEDEGGAIKVNVNSMRKQSRAWLGFSL